MTKPITSVAALMLVEAGKLRLGDPVSNYIPEFGDVHVFGRVEDGRVVLAPLARPITVHHLFTHTSGITRGAPDPVLETVFDDLGDERYALPELMRRLAAHPLAHQPGEGLLARRPRASDRGRRGPVAARVLRLRDLHAPRHGRQRLLRAAGQGGTVGDRVPVGRWCPESCRRPGQQRDHRPHTDAVRQWGLCLDGARLPAIHEDAPAARRARGRPPPQARDGRS